MTLVQALWAFRVNSKRDICGWVSAIRVILFCFGHWTALSFRTRPGKFVSETIEVRL